jgi:hypothetical protein
MKKKEIATENKVTSQKDIKKTEAQFKKKKK